MGSSSFFSVAYAIANLFLAENAAIRSLSIGRAASVALLLRHGRVLLVARVGAVIVDAAAAVFPAGAAEL